MPLKTDFEFDIFLGHSAKDRGTLRAIAERLREDGLRVWFDEWILKPGENISAKTQQGLEGSRVLLLSMSANAFGSSWSKLEALTFQFRDPLNPDRRLILLRLDEAPIKGSLTQFPYIEWFGDNREQGYAKILEACRANAKQKHIEPEVERISERTAQLEFRTPSPFYAFSPDGKRVLAASKGNHFALWDADTGRRLRALRGHRSPVNDAAWSADQNYALSGSADTTVRVWDLRTGKCLRILKGHSSSVWNVAWSNDGSRALSSSADRTVQVWDIKTGDSLHVLRGHTDGVSSLAWCADQRCVLSGSHDNTIRLWDIETGRCLRVFEGHTSAVMSLAFGADKQRILSGGHDNTLRLWDMKTGRCLRILEGHREQIWSLAWSSDERFALSGSHDKTVRLWDVETGRCLRVYRHDAQLYAVAWTADQQHAIAGDSSCFVKVWDLSKSFDNARPSDVLARASLPSSSQVQYTNAKVLIVGDTSAGKTGLAHRLATGRWKPSDSSTVGAWSTQWKLGDSGSAPGVEREIWLWDFGGQADQRLIHQLYMDRSALILLLFNADQEDVLPGLRDWQTALRRCIPSITPQFLVAGRIDAGFKASRGKLQAFSEEHFLGYYETSALDSTGCRELHAAILSTIPWEKIPVTTTEQLFKIIKDEVLKLRDEGQVLHTFKELRDLLWHRLPKNARFTDDTLRTVIGHLDAPGAVKELDYGSYILLAPEWINAYAQAVIRTLRSDVAELGRLPLRSIAEGNLSYQRVERDGSVVDMKRLPPQDERVVLAEMERQLLERGLCLQQGDKLVFPSHCGRDRPTVVEHPSVFVSYAVKGYLDDIYATLAVKLADSESFSLKELWRDAADFDTLEGEHRMGIKLTRESASSGEISVYFGPGVTQEEQVIFANYIHAHLVGGSEQVQRLRYYVCPECHTPKGNPLVLMEKLLAHKQKADTECDKCGIRFPLWDALERKFADATIRAQVEGLQVRDEIRLDARRKGKLLALEVAARITSADQKCFEIPGIEDEGLDMEVEFTDTDGRGTGKRLYLQLKAGNSYLRRKRDGTEIFRIKKQSWVKYWVQQDRPVLLVIGTFPDKADELRVGSKEHFAEIRWMEIGKLLKIASDNGKKPVKQIVFKGERLDAMGVRYWKDKVLGQELQ